MSSVMVNDGDADSDADYLNADTGPDTDADAFDADSGADSIRHQAPVLAHCAVMLMTDALADDYTAEAELLLLMLMILMLTMEQIPLNPWTMDIPSNLLSMSLVMAKISDGE